MKQKSPPSVGKKWSLPGNAVQCVSWRSKFSRRIKHLWFSLLFNARFSSNITNRLKTAKHFFKKKKVRLLQEIEVCWERAKLNKCVPVVGPSHHARLPQSVCAHQPGQSPDSRCLHVILGFALRHHHIHWLSSHKEDHVRLQIHRATVQKPWTTF